MKKSNFEKWTKDEMRFYRRELINSHIFANLPLSILKYVVRNLEVLHYGFPLKAYFYYEYHK